MKKKTSYLGFIIDSWGGVIGDLSFLVGFGLYLFNQNQNNIFLYLIIIILFLRLSDIRKHAYIMSVDEILKKKKKITSPKISRKTGYSNLLVNIKIFFSSLFDTRSRSVDFICLILLLNTFYKEMVILKYIFYFITFREIVLFLGSFYAVYFKNFMKNIKIL